MQIKMLVYANSFARLQVTVPMILLCLLWLGMAIW